MVCMKLHRRPKHGGALLVSSIVLSSSASFSLNFVEGKFKELGMCNYASWEVVSKLVRVCVCVCVCEMYFHTW